MLSDSKAPDYHAVLKRIQLDKQPTPGAAKSDPQFGNGRIDGLEQNYTEWVQKLSFTGGEGKTAYGTGFFVNIPDCEYDVMFTVAHNLVDRDKNPGQLFSDLKILAPSGNIDITPDRVRYCGTYVTATDAIEKEISDYGVILLERTANSPLRGGFGLDVFPGMADLSKLPKDLITVNITAYPSGGDLKFSSGQLFDCTEKQLKYSSATEQGSSGGVVWLGYEGRPVVVGIHNYGNPNRATRLNLTVLRQIFEWCGVGVHNKYIRTVGKENYLKFEGEPGEDIFPMTTSDISSNPGRFSIFPGFSSHIYPPKPPGSSAKPGTENSYKSPKYVFAYTTDDGVYYLDFDPDEERRCCVFASTKYSPNCQLEVAIASKKQDTASFYTSASTGFRIMKKIKTSQLALKVYEEDIDPSDPAKQDDAGAEAVSVLRFKKDNLYLSDK
ncbi:hypothetical protein TWF281_002690 [Arthrobotrys megalospora]